MDIEYKISKYFKDNNLLNNDKTSDITITNDNDTLIIKGSGIDLVELADILVSVAKDKNEKTHVHLDENSIISKESEYKEIIIEKI